MLGFFPHGFIYKNNRNEIIKYVNNSMDIVYIFGCGFKNVPVTLRDHISSNEISIFKYIFIYNNLIG